MELKDLAHDLSLNNQEDSLSTSLGSNPMNYDDVFKYAEKLKYGQLHFKLDPKTGLFAIIAIHSTKLGPAIGGCRCLPYPSTQAAIVDALRLAHMMSYKAAICGLPHGGAKAVLMRTTIHDRTKYFQSFADFVNELNGRYVTAVDSGTYVSDMDIIAARTKYVTCTSTQQGGDPSPFTATGVRRGIEAAVKFKLGKESLQGLHIAIQGVGHVGYILAKELHELGAKLTITDTNETNLHKAAQEFNAKKVSPEDIYHVECDVFAPCALGAVLNPYTINLLQTQIVAGSANNQLQDLTRDDLDLHQRGILYAPDFLINAGGLIHAAATYDNASLKGADNQIYNIYEALSTIFERARIENQPTHRIAEVIAEERLV